jgi:hypothetical protein
VNIPSRCAPDNRFAVDRVGDHRNWIPDFLSSSFSERAPVHASCLPDVSLCTAGSRSPLLIVPARPDSGRVHSRMGIGRDESRIRAHVVLPATVLSGDGRDDTLVSRQKLGFEDIVSGSQ